MNSPEVPVTVNNLERRATRSSFRRNNNLNKRRNKEKTRKNA
jgi:hypothetical protein